MRRGGADAARPRLRGGVAADGRYGIAIEKELRHGGLAAGAGPLARDLQLLELRSVPGLAHEGALSSRRGQGTNTGSYPQRLWSRDRAYSDRDLRELPAAQRHCGAPAGVAALYGRPGGHRTPWLTGASNSGNPAFSSPTTTVSGRPVSNYWRRSRSSSPRTSGASRPSRNRAPPSTR